MIFRYLGIFLAFLPFLGFSQGCSDGGFCTMGAMRPQQPYQKNLNIRLKSVEISQYAARTKFEDYIFATTLELNFALTQKWIAQIKLPYMWVNGSLANTQGLSDISLSLSRNIFATEKFQINASLGTKIPTNNANFTNHESRPLPSYYQSSLGTYDFIFGLSLLSKNWLLATGLQYAFNETQNQFIWGAWQDSPQSSLANAYPVSRALHRGLDIMFRAERSWRLARWHLNLGVLPIIRITPDTFLSPQTGTRQSVEQTKGVALTILAGISYRFSVQTGIKLIFGKQVHTRKQNLDGLSREEVLNLGYEYRF